MASLKTINDSLEVQLGLARTEMAAAKKRLNELDQICQREQLGQREMKQELGRLREQKQMLTEQRAEIERALAAESLAKCGKEKQLVAIAADLAGVKLELEAQRKLRDQMLSWHLAQKPERRGMSMRERNLFQQAFEALTEVGEDTEKGASKLLEAKTVSYTHLTLPTKRIV
eukprot:TRINITY_DN55062_c0_g1_i1.p1 TRINITY_DN55062_c0_g1~~TRINITY_DN55062_c0_g1_i1.p1  ORF type:complete len:172 (+),score=53.49 TRINITY_DN55062_c0_g1_i1:168-683(+)